MASTMTHEQRNELLGPLFIGSILDWCLLGILTVQVYIYLATSIKDPLGFKLLAYGVYVLDLVQTALATHAAWMYLAHGWGKTAVLAHAPWSEATVPLMNGIISAIVQLYFAWGIWKLKHTTVMRAIVVVVITLALAQCASVIYASALFYIDAQQTGSPKVRVGLTISLSISFVCNFLIAGSVMQILHQARLITPFGAADTPVTKLLVHTVQTGLVTVVGAGLELVLYAVSPRSNLHMAIAYILPKLYSSALLATFNARTQMFRPSMGQDDSSPNNNNNYSPNNGGGGNRHSVARPGGGDNYARHRDRESSYSHGRRSGVGAVSKGAESVHVTREVRVVLDEDITDRRSDEHIYNDHHKAYPV
ncbi:hypothetical protein PLICRDRAFT_346458 [Plicaturopsis crispa FD-325 SS-3]|uniref:Unplaced genomic scaffold PLICRscaffold_16, whole genome shotgun sequence n=1 Tax=Plicaturopsis crispa FD-325 SS-3 TaxID=944288 RepID=A0A0C9SYA8_PLICR|nr:hypothetical protein PLICRDRAFT_346458 [Plicaturopsis crispa FD-325 SS-3]